MNTWITWPQIACIYQSEWSHRHKQFLYFRFQSDSILASQGVGDGNGFLALYNSYECTTDIECDVVCGDYTSSKGILTSPFYPKPYPDDTECTYIISQPEGTFINLTIVMFDISIIGFLGIKDDYCGTTDFLDIWDGKTGDSPHIGKFCGTNIPSHIASTQNFLWIR